MTSNSHNQRYRDEYPPMLLRKVDELGEILRLAFNTTSGLPNRVVKVDKYESCY